MYFLLIGIGAFLGATQISLEFLFQKSYFGLPVGTLCKHNRLLHCGVLVAFNLNNKDFLLPFLSLGFGGLSQLFQLLLEKF